MREETEHEIICGIAGGKRVWESDCEECIAFTLAEGEATLCLECAEEMAERRGDETC